MNFKDVNPVYSPTLYFIGKHMQKFVFQTLWRRRVLGAENIPPFGTPVIFAANHRSLTDPSNIGSAVPYPIFYFAKEELFRIPILGWYIRRVNSFPVRRKDHDVSALKTAVDVLKHGGALTMFPEGGRRLDPKHQWRAKAGVGLLASKTGAQIVPVGIKHADRLLSLPQLQLIFGKPMFPPKSDNHEDYQRVADEVMLRIKELCDE